MTLQYVNYETLTSILVLDGATGNLVAIGNTQPNVPNDELFDNPLAGNLNITFDGKTGTDTVNLADSALTRTISAKWTPNTNHLLTQWTFTSVYGGGTTTINATNIEWARTSRYFSTALASYYLKHYNITTSVDFEFGASTVAGAYAIAPDPFQERNYGAANDIVYLTTIAFAQINLGAGNDMIALTQVDCTVDGGTGIDTYVVDDFNNRYSTPPRRASEAIYVVDAQGRVELYTTRLGLIDAVLQNFEIIAFGDRSIRLTTGAAGASNLTGIAGQYNVILGRDNADTITGVTAGDTLQGGNGNDLLIAASTASPMARMATNERNLLINGSFEINNAIDRRWNYSRRLEGWTSLVGTPTSFSAGGTMEIWKNFSAVRATDGSCLLELDSNNQVNGIEQRVQTVANQSYQLTLDFSARLNAAGRGNPRSRNGDTFSIYWNDTKLGDFTNRKTTWQQISLTVTGTGGVDALRFFEAPSQNDQHGILLDNVKLVAVGSNPEFSTNVLNGGAGRDTLVGSNVVDRFVFAAGDSGNSLSTADVIRQFTSGVDVVDVSELTDGVKISFVSAFTGTSGNAELITQTQTLAGVQGLLASIDLDGNMAADCAIFFEGVNSLVLKDFKTSIG